MTASASGFRVLNPFQLLPNGSTQTPVVSSGMAETSVAMPAGNTGGLWGGDWGWLTGGKNADGTTFNGVGGLALGTLSGLGNLFMGMQNYGLAKDQLKFQKDAYNKNYAAQKQTTNASLEDRQRARVASNPTAYQSVSDYMAKNRIV